MAGHRAVAARGLGDREGCLDPAELIGHGSTGILGVDGRHVPGPVEISGVGIRRRRDCRRRGEAGQGQRHEGQRPGGRCRGHQARSQAPHDALPSRGLFGEETEGRFWAAFTRLMIRIISWFLLMMGSYPPGLQVPDVLDAVTAVTRQAASISQAAVKSRSRKTPDVHAQQGYEHYGGPLAATMNRQSPALMRASIAVFPSALTVRHAWGCPDRSTATRSTIMHSNDGLCLRPGNFRCYAIPKALGTTVPQLRSRLHRPWTCVGSAPLIRPRRQCRQAPVSPGSAATSCAILPFRGPSYQLSHRDISP